jgi:molybdopterin converting factor subunit 1
MTVSAAPVRIRLLFFAFYRDLAGAAELSYELPHGSTGASLVMLLRARGDGLARLPARPVIAVNQEYTALDCELQDGDEVALLPPVAGG